MNALVESIIQLITNYAIWLSVGLGAVILALTEISKLTKLTPSTKDDLIVAKFLKEVKAIKDVVVGFIKR